MKPISVRGYRRSIATSDARAAAKRYVIMLTAPSDSSDASAQEIGSCAEALGRGTDLMVKLHALEDAGAVDALAASPYFGGALGKR